MANPKIINSYTVWGIEFTAQDIYDRGSDVGTRSLNSETPIQMEVLDVYTDDIERILAENTNDLSELCSSSRVNQYSEYAPYGYKRPSSSPYEEGDFAGYNHLAKQPYLFMLKEDDTALSSGDTLDWEITECPMDHGWPSKDFSARAFLGEYNWEDVFNISLDYLEIYYNIHHAGWDNGSVGNALVKEDIDNMAMADYDTFTFRPEFMTEEYSDVTFSIQAMGTNGVLHDIPTQDFTVTIKIDPDKVPGFSLYTGDYNGLPAVTDYQNKTLPSVVGFYVYGITIHTDDNGTLKELVEGAPLKLYIANERKDLLPGNGYFRYNQDLMYNSGMDIDLNNGEVYYQESCDELYRIKFLDPSVSLIKLDPVTGLGYGAPTYEGFTLTWTNVNTPEDEDVISVLLDNNVIATFPPNTEYGVITGLEPDTEYEIGVARIKDSPYYAPSDIETVTAHTDVMFPVNMWFYEASFSVEDMKDTSVGMFGTIHLGNVPTTYSHGLIKLQMLVDSGSRDTYWDIDVTVDGHSSSTSVFQKVLDGGRVGDDVDQDYYLIPVITYIPIDNDLSHSIDSIYVTRRDANNESVWKGINVEVIYFE